MIRLAVGAIVAGLSINFLAPAAFATSEHLDVITSECGKQLQLGSSGCTCMRDEASKLSDKQQAFVAAAVTKDQAEQQRIQGTFTPDEMMGAITFLTQAPSQCSR